MKDQGMLVMISNQMPVVDRQSLAATMRQLSMYIMSLVYIPTQNWVMTSNCWSRFPLQPFYIESVRKYNVLILIQSMPLTAEEKW